MANHTNREHVDLSESSVYADNNSTLESSRSDDFVNDSAIERLETITGGADEPAIVEGDLGRELDELDASTEEELDALNINLLQEDESPDSLDGSGLIVDDAAEESLARFTESDPMQSVLGALSVEPGRDDTSDILRRHYADTASTRSDAIVEDNLEEPMDETLDKTRTDEGVTG